MKEKLEKPMDNLQEQNRTLRWLDKLAIESEGAEPNGFAETAKLIRDMQARIRELEAVQEWRPISEAPRDGTPFLVINEGEVELDNSEYDGPSSYTQGAHPYPFICYYIAPEEMFMTEDGDFYEACGRHSSVKGWGAEDYDITNILRLTKFIPLPNKPQTPNKD